MDFIKDLIAMALIAGFSLGMVLIIHSIEKEKKRKMKNKKMKPNIDAIESTYIQRILRRVVDVEKCGTVKDYQNAIESLDEAEKRLKFMYNHIMIHPGNFDGLELAMNFIEIQRNECEKRIVDAYRWHGEMIGFNVLD